VEWHGSQKLCNLCKSQTYTLEVVWPDGARDVRTLTVNVTGSCATPTPTLTHTPPPTSTTLPQATIKFWADATTIPAGSCTTIHWETANVKAVYFDGQGVAGVDSRRTCPCSPETHTLDVVLRDGSHQIRRLTINVTGSCVTPAPGPQPTIKFWADATTIPAGSCTTIHWETANVQAVYFDGQGVVGVDSRRTCPCKTETHTLDVVLRDGSHDVRRLTINVTGSCVTPQPPQDKTPPPAPVSLKPGSTDPSKPQDLGSCSPVVLRWEPVTDQGGSGLQGYTVSLQRKDSRGQWQSIPPYFIIYQPSVDVTQWLNAGFYYRWNVTARDNAGNYSASSVWRYFSCPLQ